MAATASSPSVLARWRARSIVASSSSSESASRERSISARPARVVRSQGSTSRASSWRSGSERARISSMSDWISSDPGTRARSTRRVTGRVTGAVEALAEAARVQPEEAVGERQEVLGTLAQRRQVEGHHVEPIEEVLAEPALRDEPPEVVVRRREQAARRPAPAGARRGAPPRAPAARAAAWRARRGPRAWSGRNVLVVQVGQRCRWCCAEIDGRFTSDRCDEKGLVQVSVRLEPQLHPLTRLSHRAGVRKTPSGSGGPGEASGETAAGGCHGQADD
jgi:hypothetical protein